MIHLFKKVYLSLDVFGVFNNTSSERLYITSTEFPMPITSDRKLRQECRILGVYQSLAQADAEWGSREAFFEQLHGSDKAIVVICDAETANELMIQLWKSLFKQADADMLYSLYCLTMHNENHMAVSDSRISEKAGIRIDDICKRIIPMLTKEEFDKKNSELTQVEYLKKVPREDLSIEFSLANYLIDPNNDRIKKTLFDKMTYIVTKAYLETFVDLAMTLQRRFASLNRSNYDEMDISLCPFENMRKIPALQWTFKRSILSRDMDAVARDFSIRKTIDIYKEVDELDVFVSSEKNKDLVHIGELLLAKDYNTILEEDMRDQKRSSLFADTRFREKVNSILTSYLYRLKRLGKNEELAKFMLR